MEQPGTNLLEVCTAIAVQDIVDVCIFVLCYITLVEQTFFKNIIT